MSVSQIPLLGSHNLENVMAAALIGYLFSIPAERISQSIKSFKGLEHRLEWVTSIRGVDFYNDSKATNVDAALKSKEATLPSSVKPSKNGQRKSLLSAKQPKK